MNLMTQIMKPVSHTTLMAAPQHKLPQLNQPQPKSPRLSKPLPRSLQLSIPHLRLPPLNTQHRSLQSQLRDPAHQASVTNQTVQLNPKDPCSLTMIVISTGNVSMV